ncbi:hypothetical protein TNCV_730551 [Trichonephila clavipes]|nr:hypothetical protein TNCV_730551 [Trichonephila clavipes]
MKALFAHFLSYLLYPFPCAVAGAILCTLPLKGGGGMCPSLIAETERGLPHHLPSATHYRRLRANSIGAAISGRPGDLGGEERTPP